MGENAKDVLPMSHSSVCGQGISYNSVTVQASMQPLNLQSDLISRNKVPHIHGSSDVVLRRFFFTFKEEKAPIPISARKALQQWSSMLE